MHEIEHCYADPILDSMISHEVLIDNRSNSAQQEDYQVTLEVGERQLFFDDQDGLRFVDENLQIINHWNETFPGEQWLEVPKIPGSAMCALRMLDGGNIGSVSDGDNTFPLFDDFQGSSLDSAKWTNGGAGSISVSDGELTLTNQKYITSIDTFAGGYALRVKAKVGVDTIGAILIGFVTSAFETSNVNMTLAFDRVNTNTYFKWNSGDGVDYQFGDYATVIDAAYHIAEARRTGTVDKFKLDSESELSGNYPTNIARYIEFLAYHADIISDWVLVRKYTSPEPIAAVGVLI